MFNQYILILVWIGIMAMIQPSFYREEYNELTGEYDWRVSAGFAFVVMLPLIWVAGHRGWMMDTSFYILQYRSMPTSFSEIPMYVASQVKDGGFYVVSAVLRVILGYDHVPYLTALATFQAVAILKLYRKYSINFILSIFLFVASTDYISWMFNGLRQFLAVCLILLATPWILKKKYVSTIVVILLASTLHKSALLMIPIVIIAQGESWNKKTLLCMLGAVVAIAFVGQFTGILDSALESTQYVNVVTDYTTGGDDGTNPLRVIVYCIPALIAFLGRNRLREIDDPLINFCTNTSIVSAALYLISMVSQVYEKIYLVIGIFG